MRFDGLDREGDSRGILDSLQAGVLKGHGRLYSAYIFFNLRAESARNFVLTLRPTSSYSQLFAADRFRASGEGSSDFVSVAISASGLQKLGVAPADMPRDLAFRAGMKRARIGDEPSASWEPFFQGDIDLLVILANDEEERLTELVQSQIQAASDAGATAQHHVVRGLDRRNSDGLPVEAFGFADGVSRPLFLRSDIERFLEQSSAEAYDPTFDPRDLAIFEHPPRSGQYASYAVCRKLEQDVAQFAAETARIASHIGVAAEAIAAQAMGRHPDGTPIVLSATPDSTQTLNDFTYASDPDGLRCPLHAHSRKMNRRGSADDEAFHTIVRRGVFYEEEGAAQHLQGLLFLCYQVDIGRQFEFLQSRWANDVRFPDNKLVGLDPIIGWAPSKATSGQRWNRRWGESEASRDLFARCTFLRGGEYMFVPPIRYFEDLGT